MKRRTFVKTLPAATMLAGTASGYALKTEASVALSPIVLPPPEKEGGLSVLAALQIRSTNRNISSKELPLQVLSKYDQGPDQPDRAIGDPEVQKSYYYAGTGFIAQTVGYPALFYT